MAATDYALLSFSPSSGIGVYVTRGALHEFDLVAEDDAVLLEHITADPKIVAEFGSRDDLLAFATTEYLRDKKHMYYSTLLTLDVDHQLRDEMLEFLNHADLVAIAMAESIVATLREIGSPSRAWRCARRAESLQLRHVLAYLRTHFQTLLGPPWILTHPAPPQQIVHTPHPALTRPIRPTIEQPHWVGLRASLSERNPDSESYVRALIAGESAVREHFFIHFASRLQRRVPPYLAFMAEDIVIDALLHTLESLKEHGLRDRWQLTKYTNQFLKDSAADVQRKERRYVTLGDQLLTPTNQSVEELLWRAAPPMAAPVVPPDAEAILADALGQLQTLEPRAATVLQLRLQGRTLQEIADILRISVTAAHRNSEFARTWLREYLRGEPPKHK